MASYDITENTYKQLEFKLVLEIVAKFAYSSLGKDLINNLRPQEEIYYLQDDLNKIEEFINNIIRNDNISFEGFANIKHLIYKSKIVNAVLSTGEIIDVFDCIKSMRLIKQSLNQKDTTSPLLYKDSETLIDNKLLEKHILDCIDLNGDVKDNATRELLNIRNDIREKTNRLRSRFEKLLKEFSQDDLTSEDFITIKEGRFVVPLKVSHKRKISGIIHGTSQTGSTVFIEPSEIVYLNNDISLLMNEEKKEIYKILSNLTSEISIDANQILNSIEIVANFDSLNARALYSLEFGGIKPIISKDNYIQLVNLKHPLLVSSKGLKHVIPLTIEFTNTTRGHLISGPNAGGKTVALKSIGLGLLMALSGIYPIGQVVTNFRRIYSSIGDNQSIQNDLSTFSSQLMQLKEIIDFSDNKSLILIDEIGSGTDPQEGAALAEGILDTFLETNSFFIVTTHQSSLKTYALNKEEISNASLEFDAKKLKPTYKFLGGIPGNSYAFVLAESIGINKLVLERAKSYLGDKHSELESSINILQEYKAENEQLNKELWSKKLLAEKLQAEYEEKIKEIKLKKAQILADARTNAQDILKNANALVENTVREIKEKSKPIQDVKKYFAKEAEKFEAKIKPKKNKKDIAEIFSVGESVKLNDSESLGIIMDFFDNQKQALVDFNGVRFKVQTNELLKANYKKSAEQITQILIQNDLPEFQLKGTSKLDLRGKRADEAIAEIDIALSDAILGNIDYISVIHGKGTGALRQAIHFYLKDHPSVTSFNLGDISEGGSGITIVYL